MMVNSNVPRYSNLASELHRNYLFQFKLVLSSARSNRHMMDPLCERIMRRSIRKFNTPLPGNPPGIGTFEDWLVQIPSPRGKKAVQMPHELVLNCLSSKTNLVFNQALYMPFRERYAVMTPSIFF